ncbi:hypothetical protein AHAS_Ahas01G0236800 [Arachis hypogaea]
MPHPSISILKLTHPFITPSSTLHSSLLRSPFSRTRNKQKQTLEFLPFSFISDLVPSLELLKRGGFGAVAAEFEIGNGGRREQEGGGAGFIQGKSLLVLFHRRFLRRTTAGEKGGFLAPAPLTSKSWADVDDEDDDDYFAITAPPQSVWGAPVAAAAESEAHAELDVLGNAVLKKAECFFLYLKDIMLDILFDNEDPGFWSCSGYLALGSCHLFGLMIWNLINMHLMAIEAPIEPETVVKKPREPSLSTKETEEQLSKKELKKKELEELEAVLAELGLQKEPGSQADSHEISYLESFTCPGRKKVEDRNGELEKKENATGDSKNAKKKIKGAERIAKTCLILWLMERQLRKLLERGRQRMHL